MRPRGDRGGIGAAGAVSLRAGDALGGEFMHVAVGEQNVDRFPEQVPTLHQDVFRSARGDGFRR